VPTDQGPINGRSANAVCTSASQIRGASSLAKPPHLTLGVSHSHRGQHDPGPGYLALLVGLSERDVVQSGVELTVPCPAESVPDAAQDDTGANGVTGVDRLLPSLTPVEGDVKGVQGGLSHRPGCAHIVSSLPGEIDLEVPDDARIEVPTPDPIADMPPLRAALVWPPESPAIPAPRLR
jgi:hypothetical protein